MFQVYFGQTFLLFCAPNKNRISLISNFFPKRAFLKNFEKKKNQKLCEFKVKK